MSSFETPQPPTARRRRRLLGLTQQQLAVQVGIRFQQIQKYETGANRISASTLYRIATVFEVSPTYFFEGLEENGKEKIDVLSDRETLQYSIAIGQIPDSEVRQRLQALIDALVPSSRH